VVEQAVADVQRTPPLLDFAGPRGLQQTVWRRPEGLVLHALAEEMGAADLYIADGHHRSAAAIEEWHQAGKPADAGLLCVIHPMDGLRLSSFHRRVYGPVREDDLLALLSPDFAVREVGRAVAPETGVLGLYAGGRWFELTYQGTRPPGVAGLDATLLQTRVLDRLLAAPVERPPFIETIPATAPTDELTQRCDIDSGALFTLAPPTPEALIRVADGGEVMPPKTTYFEPKPCAGIFMRR